IRDVQGRFLDPSERDVWTEGAPASAAAALLKRLDKHPLLKLERQLRQLEQPFGASSATHAWHAHLASSGTLQDVQTLRADVEQIEADWRAGRLRSSDVKAAVAEPVEGSPSRAARLKALEGRSRDELKTHAMQRMVRGIRQVQAGVRDLEDAPRVEAGGDRSPSWVAVEPFAAASILQQATDLDPGTVDLSAGTVFRELPAAGGRLLIEVAGISREALDWLSPMLQHGGASWRLDGVEPVESSPGLWRIAYTKNPTRMRRAHLALLLPLIAVSWLALAGTAAGQGEAAEHLTGSGALIGWAIVAAVFMAGWALMSAWNAVIRWREARRAAHRGRGSPKKISLSSPWQRLLDRALRAIQRPRIILLPLLLAGIAYQMARGQVGTHAGIGLSLGALTAWLPMLSVAASPMTIPLLGAIVIGALGFVALRRYAEPSSSFGTLERPIVAPQPSVQTPEPTQTVRPQTKPTPTAQPGQEAESIRGPPVALPAWTDVQAKLRTAWSWLVARIRPALPLLAPLLQLGTIFILANASLLFLSTNSHVVFAAFTQHQAVDLTSHLTGLSVVQGLLLQAFQSHYAFAAYGVVSAATGLAIYRVVRARQAGKFGLLPMLAVAGLIVGSVVGSVAASATSIVSLAVVGLYLIPILMYVWSVVLGLKMAKAITIRSDRWVEQAAYFQPKAGQPPTHEIQYREARLFGFVIREAIGSTPLREGLEPLERKALEKAVAEGKELVWKTGESAFESEHARFEHEHPILNRMIRWSPVVLGLGGAMLAAGLSWGLAAAVSAGLAVGIGLMVLKAIGALDEVHEMMINLPARYPHATSWQRAALIIPSFFYGLYRIMHGFAVGQYTTRLEEAKTLPQRLMAPFAALRDIAQSRGRLAVASTFAQVLVVLPILGILTLFGFQGQALLDAFSFFTTSLVQGYFSHHEVVSLFSLLHWITPFMTAALLMGGTVIQLVKQRRMPDRRWLREHVVTTALGMAMVGIEIAFLTGAAYLPFLEHTMAGQFILKIEVNVMAIGQQILQAVFAPFGIDPSNALFQALLPNSLAGLTAAHITEYARWKDAEQHPERYQKVEREQARHGLLETKDLLGEGERLDAFLKARGLPVPPRVAQPGVTAAAGAGGPPPGGSGPDEPTPDQLAAMDLIAGAGLPAGGPAVGAAGDDEQRSVGGGGMPLSAPLANLSRALVNPLAAGRGTANYLDTPAPGAALPPGAVEMLEREEEAAQQFETIQEPVRQLRKLPVPPVDERLLTLLRERSGDLQREDWEVLALARPLQVLSHIPTFVREPWAAQLIRTAVEHDPRAAYTALKYFDDYDEQPWAAEIFFGAVDRTPASALEFFRTHPERLSAYQARLPGLWEHLRAAVGAAMAQDAEEVILFLTTVRDFPNADSLLEGVLDALVEHDPKGFIRSFDFIEDRPTAPVRLDLASERLIRQGPEGINTLGHLLGWDGVRLFRDVRIVFALASAPPSPEIAGAFEQYIRNWWKWAEEKLDVEKVLLWRDQTEFNTDGPLARNLDARRAYDAQYSQVAVEVIKALGAMRQPYAVEALERLRQALPERYRQSLGPALDYALARARGVAAAQPKPDEVLPPGAEKVGGELGRTAETGFVAVDDEQRAGELVGRGGLERGGQMPVGGLVVIGTVDLHDDDAAVGAQGVVQQVAEPPILGDQDRLVSLGQRQNLAVRGADMTQIIHGDQLVAQGAEELAGTPGEGLVRQEPHLPLRGQLFRKVDVLVADGLGPESKTGPDFFERDGRVVLLATDRSGRDAGRQQFQNDLNRYSVSFDAGPAAANLGIDRNALQERSLIHGTSSSSTSLSGAISPVKLPPGGGGRTTLPPTLEALRERLVHQLSGRADNSYSRLGAAASAPTRRTEEAQLPADDQGALERALTNPAPTIRAEAAQSPAQTTTRPTFPVTAPRPGIVVSALPSVVEEEAVEHNSGHHFAFGTERDNAFIGLDFGRNPYNPDPTGSVSFATDAGQARLRQALTQAVEAGESRMSFDFGFDFRSILTVGPDDRLQLDDEALASIEVFLHEVEAAHALAQARGNRRFSADVILTDYRIADGVAEENGLPIGEHPEYISDADKRAELMFALRPVFELVGRHPLVTLNLMNEPDFVAMSAAEVRARMDSGMWTGVELSPALKGQLTQLGFRGVEDPVRALESLEGRTELQVRRDGLTGVVTLSPTTLTRDQVDTFLLDLWAATRTVTPEARITIGWADDRSALLNTPRLEQQGQAVVTNVVSFHVYQVRENPHHPLTTTRADFEGAGLGDRRIRITEWGLGGVSEFEGIRDAMVDALRNTHDAGFNGVEFWWDNDHAFDREAYRQALALFTGGTASAAVSATPAPSAAGYTAEFLPPGIVKLGGEIADLNVEEEIARRLAMSEREEETAQPATIRTELTRLASAVQDAMEGKAYDEERLVAQVRQLKRWQDEGRISRQELDRSIGRLLLRDFDEDDAKPFAKTERVELTDARRWRLLQSSILELYAGGGASPDLTTEHAHVQSRGRQIKDTWTTEDVERFLSEERVALVYHLDEGNAYRRRATFLSDLGTTDLDYEGNRVRHPPFPYGYQNLERPITIHFRLKNPNIRPKAFEEVGLENIIIDIEATVFDQAAFSRVRQLRDRIRRILAGTEEGPLPPEPAQLRPGEALPPGVEIAGEGAKRLAQAAQAGGGAASGTPEGQAGDAAEIGVVGGEVDQAVGAHRGDDEGVIRQQAAVGADALARQEQLRRDRQNLHPQTSQALDRLGAGAQPPDLIGMALQVGQDLSGGQGEPLAGFQEHQPVPDLSDHDSGGDRPDVTDLRAVQRVRADLPAVEEVVEKTVGVQEERTAGREVGETHLGVQDAELVGLSDQSRQPRRDAEQPLGALGGAGGPIEEQAHLRVLAQGQGLSELQDPVFVDRADRFHGSTIALVGESVKEEPHSTPGGGEFFEKAGLLVPDKLVGEGHAGLGSDTQQEWWTAERIVTSLASPDETTATTAASLIGKEEWDQWSPAQRRTVLAVLLNDPRLSKVRWMAFRDLWGNRSAQPELERVVTPPILAAALAHEGPYARGVDDEASRAWDFMRSRFDQLPLRLREVVTRDPALLKAALASSNPNVLSAGLEFWATWWVELPPPLELDVMTPELLEAALTRSTGDRWIDVVSGTWQFLKVNFLWLPQTWREVVTPARLASALTSERHTIFSEAWGFMDRWFDQLPDSDPLRQGVTPGLLTAAITGPALHPDDPNTWDGEAWAVWRFVKNHLGSLPDSHKAAGLTAALRFRTRSYVPDGGVEWDAVEFFLGQRPMLSVPVQQAVYAALLSPSTSPDRGPREGIVAPLWRSLWAEWPRLAVPVREVVTEPRLTAALTGSSESIALEAWGLVRGRWAQLSEPLQQAGRAAALASPHAAVAQQARAFFREEPLVEEAGEVADGRRLLRLAREEGDEEPISGPYEGYSEGLEIAAQRASEQAAQQERAEQTAPREAQQRPSAAADQVIPETPEGAQEALASLSVAQRAENPGRLEVAVQLPAGFPLVERLVVHLSGQTQRGPLEVDLPMAGSLTVLPNEVDALGRPRLLPPGQYTLDVIAHLADGTTRSVGRQEVTVPSYAGQPTDAVPPTPVQAQPVKVEPTLEAAKPAEPPQPQEAQVDAIRTYVASHADPDPTRVLASKFNEGTHVMLLGDVHSERAPKRQAQAVVESGAVTHLALELHEPLLRPALEVWRRTGDPSVLREVLYEYYGRSFIGPHGDSEGELDLILAAARWGVELVFIDPRNVADPSQLPASETREQLMAERVARIVRERPDAKVLVFAGGDHARYGTRRDIGESASIPTMGERLRSQGLRTFAVWQASVDREGEPVRSASAVEEAVRGTALASRPFLLRDLAASPVAEVGLPSLPSGMVARFGAAVDAYLHLPHVEAGLERARPDIAMGRLPERAAIFLSSLRDQFDARIIVVDDVASWNALLAEKRNGKSVAGFVDEQTGAIYVYGPDLTALLALHEIAHAAVVRHVGRQPVETLYTRLNIFYDQAYYRELKSVASTARNGRPLLDALTLFETSYNRAAHRDPYLAGEFVADIYEAWASRQLGLDPSPPWYQGIREAVRALDEIPEARAVLERFFQRIGLPLPGQPMPPRSLRPATQQAPEAPAAPTPQPEPAAEQPAAPSVPHPWTVRQEDKQRPSAVAGFSATDQGLSVELALTEAQRTGGVILDLKETPLANATEWWWSEPVRKLSWKMALPALGVPLPSLGPQGRQVLVVVETPKELEGLSARERVRVTLFTRDARGRERDHKTFDVKAGAQTLAYHVKLLPGRPAALGIKWEAPRAIRESKTGLRGTVRVLEARVDDVKLWPGEAAVQPAQPSQPPAPTQAPAAEPTPPPPAVQAAAAEKREPVPISTIRQTPETKAIMDRAAAFANWLQQAEARFNQADTSEKAIVAYRDLWKDPNEAQREALQRLLAERLQALTQQPAPAAPPVPPTPTAQPWEQQVHQRFEQVGSINDVQNLYRQVWNELDREKLDRNERTRRQALLKDAQAQRLEELVRPAPATPMPPAVAPATPPTETPPVAPPVEPAPKPAPEPAAAPTEKPAEKPAPPKPEPRKTEPTTPAFTLTTEILKAGQAEFDQPFNEETKQGLGKQYLSTARGAKYRAKPDAYRTQGREVRSVLGRVSAVLGGPEGVKKAVDALQGQTNPATGRAYDVRRFARVDWQRVMQSDQYGPEQEAALVAFQRQSRMEFGRASQKETTPPIAFGSRPATRGPKIDFGVRPLPAPPSAPADFMPPEAPRGNRGWPSNLFGKPPSTEPFVPGERVPLEGPPPQSVSPPSPVVSAPVTAGQGQEEAFDEIQPPAREMSHQEDVRAGLARTRAALGLEVPVDPGAPIPGVAVALEPAPAVEQEAPEPAPATRAWQGFSFTGTSFNDFTFTDLQSGQFYFGQQTFSIARGPLQFSITAESSTVGAGQPFETGSTVLKVQGRAPLPGGLEIGAYRTLASGGQTSLELGRPFTIGAFSADPRWSLSRSPAGTAAMSTTQMTLPLSDRVTLSARPGLIVTGGQAHHYSSARLSFGRMSVFGEVNPPLGLPATQETPNTSDRFGAGVTVGSARIDGYRAVGGPHKGGKGVGFAVTFTKEASTPHTSASIPQTPSTTPPPAPPQPAEGVILPQPQSPATEPSPADHPAPPVAPATMPADERILADRWDAVLDHISKGQYQVAAVLLKSQETRDLFARTPYGRRESLQRLWMQLDADRAERQLAL
ncbi:MAG: hypothetical protein HYZ91_00705, partial [Candidatus Omnitrophica bacterium]|nr:hypothetical protein [Candidatus Omnitrophota bacterium]